MPISREFLLGREQEGEGEGEEETSVTEVEEGERRLARKRYRTE